MAKRKAEAAPVLDMVPVSAEVQETSADGQSILGWLQGLAPFFARATQLEVMAGQALGTAQALKRPESSAADEVIQKFVQKTTADRKVVEAHWEIASVVHRFHRRLTAKRDVAVKALKDANEIGNRLHNEYVAAERRRAEAEERRRREQAEFEARELQRQALERMEAEALEAEAKAEGLTEREQRFVNLFASGLKLGPQAAEIAGYRNPAAMASTLLARPKIIAAVAAVREAAAIRRQAEVRAREPLMVEDVEVKPDVTKAPGASDRTTKSAEVVDVEAFLKAALSGQFGIPLSCLAVNQAGLNAAAREMGSYINRWPGVRYVERTRVI